MAEQNQDPYKEERELWEKKPISPMSLLGILSIGGIVAWSLATNKKKKKK